MDEYVEMSLGNYTGNESAGDIIAASIAATPATTSNSPSWFENLVSGTRDVIKSGTELTRDALKAYEASQVQKNTSQGAIIQSQQATQAISDGTANQIRINPEKMLPILAFASVAFMAWKMAK